MGNIGKRKKDHVEISLSTESKFAEKTNGFENYDFLHFATSELTGADVSVQVDFFGKKISFPFLIASMTGGFEESLNINALLAEAAEELKIPIGVGSQRAMLENSSLEKTFKIIREKARSVPVVANIGAAELIQFKDFTPVQKIVETVEADALFVHLNLLQEIVQEGGKPDFTGLLNKINELTKFCEVPVIVKEVGFGIGKESAKALLDAGVQGIDVAGAGGTSWSKIEQIRNGKEPDGFSEWGLPTSYCVRTVAELKAHYDFLLIASGGIQNSFDFAKALALGGDLASSAGIILKTVTEKGASGVVELLKKWNKDLITIMILTNSKNVQELKGKLILKKELF